MLISAEAELRSPVPAITLRRTDIPDAPSVTYSFVGPSHPDFKGGGAVVKPSEIGYSTWEDANRYSPKERKRRQEAQDRASDWGVFPWEAANMYRRESAIRIYRRRGDADRFAEKSDPALNLVVRSLDREVRS